MENACSYEESGRNKMQLESIEQQPETAEQVEISAQIGTKMTNLNIVAPNITDNKSAFLKNDALKISKQTELEKALETLNTRCKNISSELLDEEKKSERMFIFKNLLI